MNIVFFGSPEFAVPSLNILNSSKYNIKAIITTPDKPSGRGMKINHPIIKKVGEKLKYPIYQPEDLKDNHFLSTLKQLNAEIFIVVAFRILPIEIFSLPKFGAINLHASLLPKYRGSSPIHRAILNGDKQTGVTTFKITKNVDRGNIFLQKNYTINDNANMGKVYYDLSRIGANLLLETIDGISNNTLKPIKQNNQMASNAFKMKKQEFRIDWNESNINIHNKIRALTPYPGAYTILKNKRIKLFDSILPSKTISNLNPGEIYCEKDYIIIGTGSDNIAVKTIQLEGRKRLFVKEYLKGNNIFNEEYFK